MYCKKCGYHLEDGDRFCAQCGAKISEYPGESVQEEQFNPMFRKESEEASNTDAPKISKRNFHIEDFNWDLDGFPTEKKKKTDDIDFNWESVMNDRGRSSATSRKPSFDDRAFPFETKEGPEEDNISLEEEIFSDEERKEDDSKKTVRIDKFYTFNKKNEEFQALLDKEYNRIKSGHDDEDEEPDNLTVEEITSGMVSESEDVISTVESDHETNKPFELEKQEAAPFAEKISETIPNEEGIIGVVLADSPETMVAGEEINSQEAAEDILPPSEEITRDEKKEQTGEAGKDLSEQQDPQRKLTYDDIFNDDEDVENKPKKKNRALKVIAVILGVLVVAELIILGLRTFAPESGITIWIQSIFNNIQGFFSGASPKG